jgi:hypothetical protein
MSRAHQEIESPMDNRFFERPILNSPYAYPVRHWELDAQGQPTQQIIEKRRRAEFISPIPKPRKRKGSQTEQAILVFDEGKGLSTTQQQYETTSTINALRRHVDEWRGLPNNLKQYGLWTFAGFTEIYQMEGDFEARVEAEFNKMSERITG